MLALLREREQRERDGRLTGCDGRGGDAALELGDAPLEHEHRRVRGAAVDVAVAAQREQVARLAQRGELERVRLVDRRHGGVLGDTGLVPRLHLRRREGTRGLGHASIVERVAAAPPESCVELLRALAPRRCGYGIERDLAVGAGLDHAVRLGGIGEREGRAELDREAPGGHQRERHRDGLARHASCCGGERHRPPPENARMPKDAASRPRTIVAMRS